MSGALLIHDFAEVVSWTRYAPNYQTAVLTFDADFVTGNVIDLMVNGKAMVSVPFHTSQAITMGDLITAIQAIGETSAVSVVPARGASMICKYAATELIIDNVAVTHGATQANGSITSRSGGYVNGIWQTSAPVALDIEMSVQPLNGHELVQLPEGDRSREWLKGYTSIEMQIADEANGTRGDWITYNGKNYEVQKSERWMVTDLNHYKILMAEVNVEQL